MKPGLSLRVSQHLALTPQLQQSIRLLQLSTLELASEVEQMLDDNPFLEREDEHAPREAQKANFRAHIEAAREAGLGRLQKPGIGSKQRVGVGAVRLDSNPAFDAPGFVHTAQLDCIVGQRGRSKWAGGHVCGADQNRLPRSAGQPAGCDSG